MKPVIKIRNWLAVEAHLRGGSGNHGSKRREDKRKACRGKVNVRKEGW